MALHCGRRYRVATPVRSIILEENGTMAQLTNTVILDGLVCEGICSKNCPRANYLSGARFGSSGSYERAGSCMRLRRLTGASAAATIKLYPVGQRCLPPRTASWRWPSHGFGGPRHQLH